MVSEQLVRRGIRDTRVLAAMARVPRHLFVPESLRHLAYEDCPLPIGSGQTISQPYIVALMVEALQLTSADRVLDVGTGSGYQAAVLAELSHEVWSIEIVAPLAERARATLADLGCANVHVVVGDGSIGLPEHAPYDGIVVAAGSPDVPEALTAELVVGGRLVLPVGSLDGQVLQRMTRTRDGVTRERLTRCAFVPLVGAGGWAAPPVSSGDAV